MIGVGLLGAIVVGLLAGFIAERIMGESHGLLVSLIVGLIGAVIGPQILAVLGVFPNGVGIIPSLIVSTVGAIVLLAIVNLIRIGRPTVN